MSRLLGASTIYTNVQKLKGYTTKRELAEFFGVGPSSISDWVTRKGNTIPAKRLADACDRHGLRWQWLACGEGPPYEVQTVDEVKKIDLDPGEVELLGKLKCSPHFRRAVEKLLGMDETQIKLLTKLAESMAPPREETVASSKCSDGATLQWNSSLPLTRLR